MSSAVLDRGPRRGRGAGRRTAALPPGRPTLSSSANDVTSPAHPEGAQAFLNTLPNSTRRLGEKLVADRKVARVVEVKPGTHYRADVESFDPARVEVRCDRLGVWRSDCTCVVGNNCKHAYALLRQVVKQAGQPGSAATASPAAFR